jgi:hypothetical protein
VEVSVCEGRRAGRSGALQGQQAIVQGGAHGQHWGALLCMCVGGSQGQVVCECFETCTGTRPSVCSYACQTPC